MNIQANPSERNFLTAYKIKPTVLKRIEELGQMDDRHKMYLAQGNVQALIELAIEYETRGMTSTARKIREEAEGVR